MTQHFAPATADGSPRWGYERPECQGEQALALFLDDLTTLIDRHANAGNSPESLAEAQRAVDALLAGYRTIAATQGRFDDATVTLHHAHDEQGVEHLFPVFSPMLKRQLFALLKRSGHANQQ